MQISSYPKGYLNFGNSCFFNSAIQALLSLDFFRTKLEDNIVFKADSLRDFALGLPWFKFGEQMCAHETLIKLIETFKLEKFFTTIYERVKICTCGTRLLNQDIVISHLASSVENISKNEAIIDNCECGNTRYRLITYLRVCHNAIIFNLNKFQQNLPTEITLKTINNNYIKYELKAVIYHIGSPNNGHYFVRVLVKEKNSTDEQVTQKIVQIDDNSVIPVDSFSTINAHIALYECPKVLHR